MNVKHVRDFDMGSTNQSQQLVKFYHTEKVSDHAEGWGPN